MQIFTIARKVKFIALFAAILGASLLAYAQQDTLVVQTFSFSDPSPCGWSQPYRGNFSLPDGSEEYEKILMYWTLKCDPATNADGLPCGEWDYTTHAFVTNYDGIMDSTRRTHTNFTADGQTFDNFAYTNSSTFEYLHDYQKYITHTNIIGLTVAQVSTGTTVNPDWLNNSQSAGKSQFLWLANELTAAGLTAGNLTGIRLDVNALGGELKNLSIQLRHSNLTELAANYYETADFTEVYRQNTDITATGWTDFQFVTPFAWDGISNISVQFSFDADQSGSGYELMEHDAGANLGVYAAGNEGHLNFKGANYVDVPADAFDNIGDEITIELWQFGDVGVQPQSDIIFEAADANGNRVLNCHLPWGDGTVYWDAGNEGNCYDRVQKAANTQNYEGRWNHWAFVKNVAAGQMRIYLNGLPWASGSGKFRPLNEIANFRIGGNALNTNNSYDGKVDEFRVWSKALGTSDIRDWMNRRIDATHPEYASLQLYYELDEIGSASVFDSSPNGMNGFISQSLQWEHRKGKELQKEMTVTQMRPNIMFEQGEYDSEIDSTLVIVPLPVAPVELKLFENDPQGSMVFEDAPDHPNVPTQILTVWEAGIDLNTYDNYGNIISTDAVIPDETIVRSDIEYYSNAVDYEIGRYITPYGGGIDLGPEGTRWIYDVTDYAPILRNDIALRAGNNQELLDLKFVYIKGTPPREVIKIKNLWNGYFSYAGILDNTHCAPINVALPQNTISYRIKTRTTGHEFGINAENCAEFCPKEHYLFVNGIQRFAWNLWNECADNPIMAQGGTWIYDRAGWCPGDKVQTYNHELTPFATSGGNLTLDYEMEGSGAPAGGYNLYSQLIMYGDYNFNKDAAMEDIIAPSRTFQYSRLNPICDNPIVRIKNNGSSTLTSAIIVYGVQNPDGAVVTTPGYYQWSGGLGIGEMEDVVLPLFNWTNLDVANPIFYAEIVEPNASTDEYENNNRLESAFDLPSQYETGMRVEIRTNNAPWENAYTIKDQNGNTIYSRSGMTATTLYDDPLNLDYGCYTFEFTDSDEDGISWWANSDGTGWVRLKAPNGTTYLTFNPDYGKNIKHQFTVGYQMGEENYFHPSVDITGVNDGIAKPHQKVRAYPNPTKGTAYLEFDFAGYETANIEVFNALGERVLLLNNQKVKRETLEIELPQMPGVYFIKIKTKYEQFNLPMVVSE